MNRDLDDEPLVYEPEFSGAGDYDDETPERPSFAGLPDLEPEIEEEASPKAALPDLDADDSSSEVSQEEDTAASGPEEDSGWDSLGSDGGMVFDDGFNDGLDNLGLLDEFISKEEEDPSESEPESKVEDSDGASEFEEGLELDESEGDSPESDAEDAEDPELSGEDDDDASSLTDGLKTAGAAVSAGGVLLLKTLQKTFAKLPVVGKLVTNLVRTGVVLALIVLIPIALVVVSSAIVRSASAPSETATVSLPDNGGAKISDVQMSDDGKTAKAKITNTGDVIAKVEPGAVLSSVELTKPLSWYSPVDSGACRGKPVEVDIDASVDVTLTCSSTSDPDYVAPTLK